MISGKNISGYPKHWEVRPFTDVVNDSTAGNHKIPTGDYLSSGSLPIIDQGQQLIGGYTSDGELKAGVELPAIIFGDHTRVFKFIDFDFAIGADGAKILEPKNGVKLDKRFLFHYLNNIFIESAGYSRHFKFLKEMYVPLPPLEEQKRIAAILDKADAIRRKRQQAIKLADDFLRSVFLEMFGDPVTNPKGWELTTLGDLIHFAKDGPHVSPEYADEGIPFLSTRHVKPSGLVWDDLKYVTQEVAEIHWKKCKPKRGDVLYTKGGTTGIACSVDFDKDFAVWVHVALLRPNKSKVNYIWLAQMLNSKYCYDQSQKHTRGATNKDLGLKRMVEIEMFCPPITEQNKFVEIKNRVENLINRSESFNQSQLFESLSQKAFSGKL